MKITVRRCEDGREWSDLLHKAPHATVFHEWEFLKIMEKHSKISTVRSSKAELHALVGMKNDEPIGLYPIYHYRQRFVRSVFSPPLSSGVTNMGPVLLDYDSLKQGKKEDHAYALQKAADEYMSKELRANLVKIRTPQGSNDARAYNWNGYKVEPAYHYEIDLSRGMEAVWEGFDKELRKNIRKTSEKGVQIREGLRSEMDQLYGSLAKRFNEQGGEPDISREYLHEVYDALSPHNMRFLVADDGRGYVSGLLVLTYRGRASAWIGTAKTETPGLYPNDLLLWEAMKWAETWSHDRFEIIWANTRRLCIYKSKYSPAPKVYFSCTKMSPAVSALSRIRKTIAPDHGVKKDDGPDN